MPRYTPSYTINEPHPTVLQNSYTHSGRGGAGNTFRVATSTTPSSGVPTQVTATQPSSSSSATGRFYSGRGGAGNAHPAAQRPVLSFDEEYARAAREQASSSGHVGRGGAGNTFGSWEHRSGSNASSEASVGRRDSASTNSSVKSGFWGRLSSGSLGHH